MWAFNDNIKMINIIEKSYVFQTELVLHNKT